MNFKKYVSELKRRHVFKSAIAYLITAWLILQVSDIISPLFEIPPSILKTLLYILGIGFPIWLVFSWIYDITLEGVKKTDDVNKNTEKSIFDNRRFNKAIIASLSLAVMLLLVNIFWNRTEVLSNSSQLTTSAKIERKSIAVLPFENRSKLEDDVFFTDGIHDDLLTEISKIKEIKTISRTSVMEYRNTTKNIRIIGKELGVTTILEGGIQRAGNQIRINVQLIDVMTDEHLWAETYTRELTAENIFVIQSEISQAIASALKAILSPQEQQNIDKLPTQNLAALEAWFQAKERLKKRNSIASQEAMDYLNLAIKLDSTFAIAYAVLGQITLNKFWWSGLPIGEQIKKGKVLIEKAMRLDSTISDVQRAFGYLNSFQMDFEAHGMSPISVRKLKPNNINLDIYEKYFSAAEKAYQKAIELNSNNAEAYRLYGEFQLNIGKISEGFKLLYKARELNPVEDDFGLSISYSLIKFGRFEEARQIIEEIIKRKPKQRGAYGLLANLAFFEDFQIAESIRYLRKEIALDPYQQFNSIMVGIRYFYLGDKKHAIKWLNHALQLAPESQHAENIRAFIYYLQEEYNKSFDAYIKVPEHAMLFNQSMFFLMELGFLTNRSKEVIEHFKKVYPDLFLSNIIIDESNFISALALGRLLKAKGDYKQANHLLKESLKIAQEENFEGWTGRYQNWESRINLALGNNSEALFAYKKLVDIGWHLNTLLIDPIYKPLYKEPEYQKMIKIMKTRLEEEREILREMEANGELDIPLVPKKG